MWTSNRRHVYLVCVIRLHPNGVFSNVLMQNQRHENRKTSGWSKSACSVNGRQDRRDDGSMSTLLETMNNYHLYTCLRLYDRL